jgi:hypothetical protein
MRPLTVRLHVAALRFFFVKTLKRRYLLDDTPYPKAPRRLPQILSVEEVARVIDAADSLSHRTMLMVLYSTGMRNTELRHLQVADIDSRRMLIHIQRGKGGRDRYVPLSPTLLTTLRVYYRWMRPKTWLFPGTVDGWRADKPITPKVLWEAPWNGGRNHFGQAFCAVLAGGGFKGGHVVGATDAKGEEVKERPIYPCDVIGSIYAQLGIPTDAKLPHPQGLDVRVTPSAADGMKSGGLLKEIM